MLADACAGNVTPAKQAVSELSFKWYMVWPPHTVIPAKAGIQGRW